MSFSDPINSYCNVFRKFGMLPFEKRRGLLRPPKILICVHFTVFLACVSLGIFHFSGSHVYQELTQLVVTAFAYSALAIIYVSWFYSIFQVNFIGEFIKIIDVTAPRFIHYTSTFKSSFLLKMIVLHYICFLAASICWILLVPTPLFSIVYILVSTQLIVNTVPFGSFVSLVGDYFDQLHSSLTYSGNSFDTSKTNLRALLVIFDRLCFGIDQLIAYYEYPITSIIAYSFVAVVSEIYYLLFHWGSVFSFFASWSWVSFHSSILLFLIWTCDRVKRKVGIRRSRIRL